MGLIYIFTGEGKGKTSAALGVAVRAVCAGLKVAWVAWYKEEAWPISEKKLSEFLPIEMYFLGKGFYIKAQETGNKKQETENSKLETINLKHNTEEGKDSVSSFQFKVSSSTIKTASLKGGGLVVDDNSPSEHRQAALAALEKASELLSSQELGVLVCDEINNALREQLLTWEEVQALIEIRGPTHLVLTGREADPRLIKVADLVTSMEKVKHPYDRGVKAVRGLDF